MSDRPIGRYAVEGLLGTGATGSVYLAYDPRLDRRVAIKVLHAGAFTDGLHRRRFQWEAQAASALNHPNIASIHDIDHDEESDFIVMEHVAGLPLSRAIPAEGLPVNQALGIAIQISSAIVAAHGAGILHRDIKPANVLLATDGTAKVVDFGLAKIAQPVADARSTVTALTQGIHFIGTPAYAAPEQVECKELDARADVFAIGAVLYEMLTGTGAFRGDSPAAVFAAVLHAAPLPFKTFRHDIPGDLEKIVFRCLAKDVALRYQSAADVLSALRRCESRRAAARAPIGHMIRRPEVIAAVLTLVVVASVLAAWLWTRESRARWVASKLPEAAGLVRQGNNFGAVKVLREVEAYAPDNPRLHELLAESTATLSILTTPPHAEVWIRGFPDAPQSWEFLGHAPLKDVRLPRGNAVWRIVAPSFQSSEVLGLTMSRNLEFTLAPTVDAPEGMVHVPARPAELLSPDANAVDEFWIDQYEVTNRQFQDFVAAGGYETPQHWTEPFVNGGVKITAEDARQLFKDRTGRPAPATWQLGRYPDGLEDHPVSGVSWYEAAAYCRSVGKQLPTIHHWYGAASLGGATELAAYGNFLSNDTQPVGQPLRLGVFGTYDMAGNVKEWCWNEAEGQRRFALGGGFRDPSYAFRDPGAHQAFDRSPANGFRCVQYVAPVDGDLMKPVSTPFRDFRRERPVNDAVFAVYESLYEYDRTPVNGSVDAVESQAADWTVQRVSFLSADGSERVAAFVWVPTNTPPPYQTVIGFRAGTRSLAAPALNRPAARQVYFCFCFEAVAPSSSRCTRDRSSDSPGHRRYRRPGAT